MAQRPPGDRFPSRPERRELDLHAEVERWRARTSDGGYVAPPAGWWPLLSELADRLDAVWPAWQVLQVKQKLASLEVYLKAVPDELVDVVRIVVDAAKSEAAATCEVCGLLDGDAVTMSTTPSGYIGRFCGRCVDAERGGR